jgi:hypothetical protein
LSFISVPAGDELGAQAVVLGIAAVAPVDIAGFGQRRHVAHPFDELAMAGQKPADLPPGRAREVGSWRFPMVKEKSGARLHRAAWRQRRVEAR